MRPEIEARLATQAQLRGLDLETYAEKIIEDAVSQNMQSERELTTEEFRASLNTMTRFSDKIPALPIEAFTRESFYEDVD